jgi:hypothetical protein
VGRLLTVCVALGERPAIRFRKPATHALDSALAVARWAFADLHLIYTWFTLAFHLVTLALHLLYTFFTPVLHLLYTGAGERSGIPPECISPEFAGSRPARTSPRWVGGILDELGVLKGLGTRKTPSGGWGAGGGGRGAQAHPLHQSQRLTPGDVFIMVAG